MKIKNKKIILILEMKQQKLCLFY